MYGSFVKKALASKYGNIGAHLKKLPYRFDYENTIAWKDYLDQNGFVVVGAINADETHEAMEGMIDSLCYLSDGKLKKNDPETFKQDANYPYMWKSGMIQYVAHTRWQWDLREKVAHVFAKAWDEKPENMATSFDGFCFMHGERKFDSVNPLEWLHTDQSGSKDFKWCIQGVLNLLPSDENDGGLVVIPKSHEQHANFFKKIGKTNLDMNFYTVTEEEKKAPLFKSYMKVCAEPGDLLLFDSRTFHCNVPPTSGRTRACSYICQMPHSKVKPEIRKQRKIVFQDHRVSTHHPGEDFEVFPLIPYEASESLIPKIERLSLKFEDLTPMQRSLCCFSDFKEEYRYKKIGEPVLPEEEKMVLIRMRPF